MDLALKDKIIIVSGGAKGIGEGITNVLALEGAIPIIIGRSEEDNLALVKLIQKQGYQADQVVAELTEPAACENAIKQIANYFFFKSLVKLNINVTQLKVNRIYLFIFK